MVQSVSKILTFNHLNRIPTMTCNCKITTVYYVFDEFFLRTQLHSEKLCLKNSN